MRNNYRTHRGQQCIPLRSWGDLRFLAGRRSHGTKRLGDDLDVGAVLAPDRWSGFGDMERHAAGLPRAFFDWSGGEFEQSEDDLALDPRICDRKAARLIVNWWRAAPLEGDRP